MTEVPATFFDGQSSRASPVTLRFDDNGTLHVAGDGVDHTFARGQVRVESRLGDAPRFVRLPGDARCEVRDNDLLDRAVAAWPGRGGGRLLHRLEKSWRLVVLAVVVLGFTAFLLIRFGLPAAAKHIAYRLPMAVSERLGSDALSVLDRLLFAPSKLPAERQAELHEKFRAMLQRQADTYAYRLEFRASPRIGANALALPNGTIVMTDELVALARHDDEILGVLAHECGHVQGRHALRSLLQNSAVVVVITLATGDMSGVSALGAALPTILLEAKYSRLFETEADAYGVDAMRAAGLDPVHLANILERLSGGTGGTTEEMLSYVSSHPATPERVQAIKDAAGPPALSPPVESENDPTPAPSVP
jgi:Zn-dependent protease with chaperone function